MSPSFVENISVSDLARSRTLKELIASVSRPSYTLTEFIEQVCCVMYDTVGMDPASLSIVASPHHSFVQMVQQQRQDSTYSQQLSLPHYGA